MFVLLFSRTPLILSLNAMFLVAVWLPGYFRGSITSADNGVSRLNLTANCGIWNWKHFA